MRRPPSVDPGAPERPERARTEISAPPGLSASRLELDGHAFAVLEWPLEWQPPAALTEAEREVLAGVVAGLANSEIARRRGTSVRTVANQVAGMLDKLRVGSRYELIARTVQPARDRRPGRRGA